MSINRIKTLVAGATGYVGLDLVYLLSKHPNVKIKYLCAKKNIGKNINSFDKRIKKKLPKISNIRNAKLSEINLIFLALPNGEAQKMINKIYKKYPNIKFIDLSADFRIQNPIKYKKWYNINHKANKLIKNSLYSISEFVKLKIKSYRIIANPGCYPTSIQLPLVPLLKEKLIKNNNIIIDSKSGYSGAGKNFKNKFSHKNLFSSTFSYAVLGHRHMAEIDQEFFKHLKINLNYTFNPHVIPSFRGILSSIYVEPEKGVTINKIRFKLKKYYKSMPFVKILTKDKGISTGNVIHTNNCEISICNTRKKNKFVIFSAIDNLIKGASGQAVQNMNLIYNFKETIGLK